jgi:hypothetical protein
VIEIKSAAQIVAMLLCVWLRGVLTLSSGLSRKLVLDAAAVGVD